MVTRRDWLFSLIRSIAICRSSADKSSDSASKLLKPTIAFSGVRISWLILARNKVLFSSEIFASCSKACNSFCLFFKLSISEHRPNGCLRQPWGVGILWELMVNSVQRQVPWAVSNRISIVSSVSSMRDCLIALSHKSLSSGCIQEINVGSGSLSSSSGVIGNWQLEKKFLLNNINCRVSSKRHG